MYLFNPHKAAMKWLLLSFSIDGKILLNSPDVSHLGDVSPNWNPGLTAKH